MLSSIGRGAIRRIGTAQSHTPSVRVGEWTWQVQRVCIALSQYDATAAHSRPDTRFAHSIRRSFATGSDATPKPRAKKATTAGEQSTTRKPSTAKKAAAKPKAKPKKKKARSKKVLTEVQKAKRAETKAKLELKALKATALLSPPKELPSSAWAVLISEQMKGKSGQSFPGLSKSIVDISARYKNLDPSEREHYNHIANQNRLANEAAFKTWVESHTPDQIRAANLARLSLKRKIGKKGSSKYSPIEDPRIPKRPRGAIAVFTKERWASGDLKGISLLDATKALQNEWSTLSAAEKKHFEDVAAADKTRYAQEYKTVFHRDLPTRSKAAATA